MFTNGEESGTCPECGSTALLERLEHRAWRNRIWSRSIGIGIVVTLFGAVGIGSAAFVWSLGWWVVTFWPCIAPIATLIAVVSAGVGFRDHVRVRAAGGEYWALLFSIGIVSGIVNVLLQGVLTVAGMLALGVFMR